MDPHPQVRDAATPEDPAAVAVALSQAMLEAARRSEWAEVAKLEAPRSRALERLFSPGVRAAQAERVAAAAREVLALNQEVAGLVRAACQRVGGDLQSLRLARRAVDVYRNCAG